MKYEILYVDPPWSYGGNTSWVLNHGEADRGFGKVIRDNNPKKEYPTMTIEELKSLSIDPYQIVYADPPWDYGAGNATLQEGQRWAYGKQRNIDKIRRDNKVPITQKYPTMTIEELKSLSIDPYQILYADPPWHYDRDMGKALRKTDFPNVDKHYPTMSTEEISALPIKDIVAKDAACFMWTTDTHLPYAIEIMKTWGFQYKTIAFIWVKQTINGKQVKMLAPWTNKGAELCLFGTRGAMTKHLGANDVFQVHHAVRREHSRKPDIIRDEIKRMFPDCKRIELFARTAMPGWDAWGNEVEKFSESEKKKVVGLF